MRKTSVHTRLFAGVLALVGAAALACSSPEDSDSDSVGASGPSGPPHSGGTYRYAVTSDAPTLDVLQESSFATHGAVGMVYSKLVDFKTGPDVPYTTAEIEGDLAESWTSSPDATQWTFQLRPSVKWHDVAPVNGREFTSADVACTMQAIKDTGAIQLSSIEMVSSVETPDDNTVVFHLAEPFADFATTMAGNFMWILPCEATQGQVDLETTAIGTGPFILDSWDRDQERRYVANPDYYESGKPYLDAIDIVVLNDASAAIAALRTQKIDSYGGFNNKEQADSLLNSYPDLQVRQEQSMSSGYLYMNQTREPFDDVRVRKAVAMAINSIEMGKALRYGPIERSGPIPPMLVGGLTSDEVAELQPYDPDQAKALLTEAGFPNGFSTTLLITDGYGETPVKEAQWIQQDLADVGITVQLDIQDYAKYFTDSYPSLDYDLGFGQHAPQTSADEYLFTNYKSDGFRQWFGMNDPELDAMIVQQRGIVDPAERTAFLEDISRYMLENVANPVYTYMNPNVSMFAPYVAGAHPHATYSNRWLKDVWLGPDAPGRGDGN